MCINTEKHAHEYYTDLSNLYINFAQTFVCLEGEKITQISIDHPQIVKLGLCLLILVSHI